MYFLMHFTAHIHYINWNVGRISGYYHDSSLNIDIVGVYVDRVLCSLMCELYISYKMLINKHNRAVVC